MSMGQETPTKITFGCCHWSHPIFYFLKKPIDMLCKTEWNTFTHLSSIDETLIVFLGLRDESSKDSLVPYTTV